MEQQTNTNRTILQLLEILLDHLVYGIKLNVDKLPLKEFCGLCTTLYNMYIDDILTYDEHRILKDYIIKHRPELTWYTFFMCNHNSYWWIRGRINPRIRFVKKLIKHEMSLPRL